MVSDGMNKMVNVEIFVQALINGIMLGGVYALLSSGLSLVAGISRIPNASHGAFAILGGFVAYWLFTLFGVDPLLSLPLSMALLFVIGIFCEKVFIHKLIGDIPTAFNLTFFLAYALENLMVVCWTNEFRMINVPYLSSSIMLGPFYLSISRLLAFVLGIAILVVLVCFLKFTYMGKAVRAVSENSESAQLCGINKNFMYSFSFALSLSLAAAAGVLLSTIYSFYPGLTRLWAGKLFAIIVLGGMGSLSGALVASFIIGIVDVVLALFVPSAAATIISWLILVVTLMIRPTGLFGKR
jgi:branched-chain amino acid transport system permease protein